MSTVIPFRPAQNAPVQPIKPRRHFGLRAAMDAAGDADARQRERIRALAAEARNAFDGGKAVCPTLLVSLAARVQGLATAANLLAQEAKSYGLLREAVALQEHEHLLDTLSAEIEERADDGGRP